MIEVKQLNKTYDRGRFGDHRVLKDVSFDLPDTGFVCILGPSGCGKTSLLNAIGGLDRFDNGTLCAGDTKVSRYGTAAYEAERNRNFGYIFQNYYLLENHSVAYNVYLGLHSLKLSHAQKLKRVRMALQAVDMERYIRRRVGDLSGGQQQRIAIARALARRPRVIFADEPTGNLDEANTRNICTLLRQASRESLVIMVTHEEHIARFFADRIITLDQGCIRDDSTSWNRENLRLDSDKVLYSGEFADETVQQEGVSLRLLQSEGAEPVELTVVAMKDRIVLKLSDSRAVILSGKEEAPQIQEGKRPVMTLETVDAQAQQHSRLFLEPPAQQCPAGKGLRPKMLFREARTLMKGKGLKRAGMRIFLILLTVLTILTVADFVTISQIDPQDFITTDSHILKIRITQGPTVIDDGASPPLRHTWLSYHQSLYAQHVADCGLDFDFIPLYSIQPECKISLFYQMTQLQQKMPPFSYASAERLDPSTLLCGRMPQTSEEVVLDRILLDAMLKSEGIVQNSVTDYSSFLGLELYYGNKGLNPVIVGVSNSGERSVYTTESTLYSLGARGSVIITASELQNRFPGKYDKLPIQVMESTMVPSEDGQTTTIVQQVVTVYVDPLEMEDDECIVNIAKAGDIWQYRIDQDYGYFPNQKKVVAWMNNSEMSAHIVVSDHCVQKMIQGTYTDDIVVWCADKEAMKAYLSQKTELEEQGHIQVTVSDPYQEKYNEYAAAASIRADARTIVTATILLLSMVMLWLLCRSQVQERLGLVAVYRLLGIPGRKLHAIFLMEGALSALTTILPVTVLIWLGIHFGSGIPELKIALKLPWQAAAAAGGGVMLFYLLVCVLPLIRLLRLPPAQLAAKYDM